MNDVQRADDAAGPGSEDQPPLVVVVGAVNVDTVVLAPRHPRPGETVLGTDVASLPGGKGANQAIASAVAGATTSLVAAVGADAEGRRCLDHLVGRGVDTRSVRVVSGAATGYASIVVSDAGENSIVVVPGANRLVTADAVAAAIRPGTAVVLVQLEVPEAAARATLVRAREIGALALLNASPVVDAARALTRLADVIVVNEHEHELLGAPSACVTLGARGAIWGPFSAAPPPVDVVDTTGAGDAFAGTLAARLALGAPRERALQDAVDAGARATTYRGAQASLPIS